jgi:predicted MFS family arabinose efflux permease
MMINPLFASMASQFSVPVSYAGYVTGTYTLGSVISGLCLWKWIDRLNAKRFLLWNMALLGVLTVLITFPSHYTLLLVLRLMAGLVGGTTMGVGMSLVVNLAPAGLRAQMIATVIAAFSVVSIAGMPAMLFLSTHFGWQNALRFIGLLCLISLPLITAFIPHVPRKLDNKTSIKLTPEWLFFAGGNAVAQFTPMLITPALVPLLTQHMQAETSSLPTLFLIGGIAGLIATKLTGKLLAHLSSYTLAVVSTLILLVSMLLPATGLHASALFMGLFLGGAYGRLVVVSCVTAKFPDETSRAGFLSLQTALMSLSTTLAFFLSAMTFEIAVPLPSIFWGLVVGSALLMPAVVKSMEKRLARREA